MPNKKPVHTVPTGTGWANKQGGETLSNHRKKETAVAAGRTRAKADQTEHRIHKKDGTIAGSNSYGNDPNPPRDKNR